MATMKMPAVGVDYVGYYKFKTTSVLANGGHIDFEIPDGGTPTFLCFIGETTSNTPLTYVWDNNGTTTGRYMVSGNAYSYVDWMNLFSLPGSKTLRLSNSIGADLASGLRVCVGFE